MAICARCKLSFLEEEDFCGCRDKNILRGALCNECSFDYRLLMDGSWVEKPKKPSNTDKKKRG